MTKSSASTAILLVAPFAYPPAPHIRRHGPTGYVDYVSFKPWLRDECICRCVYCLSRETWYPNGVAGFSVDHVEPQVLRPDLVTVYINLVYACNRCNSIKREVTLLPDPTKIALGDLLSVDEQGRISGRTSDGLRMIDIPSRLVRQENQTRAGVAEGDRRCPRIREDRAPMGYPELPGISFHQRTGTPLPPPCGRNRGSSDSVDRM